VAAGAVLVVVVVVVVVVLVVVVVVVIVTSLSGTFYFLSGPTDFFPHITSLLHSLKNLRYHDISNFWLLNLYSA
jgi:hypothetical protein